MLPLPPPTPGVLTLGVGPHRHGGEEVHQCVVAQVVRHLPKLKQVPGRGGRVKIMDVTVIFSCVVCVQFSLFNLVDKKELMADLKRHLEKADCVTLHVVLFSCIFLNERTSDLNVHLKEGGKGSGVGVGKEKR